MGKILHFIKLILDCIIVAGIGSELIPESFINQHPWLAEIVNIIPSKIIIFALLLLFFIYFLIKENIDADIQYRIEQHPEQLCIEMNSLKASSNLPFNTINIHFEIYNPENSLIKLFSKLKFKPFISFESPPGTILKYERLKSDFKRFGSSTTPELHKIILIGDKLPLQGERKIGVDFVPDLSSTFEGNGYISVKLYIAPSYELLNCFPSILLNKCKIAISK
ncbi:MAG: hypothetical protein NHB15_08200 [Methanosarcina barkeri]|nr:hypothetical protein [Methanosarcina sp. ERenArc_MAG2]